MCSTTGFNIPSLDIHYSNVARRHGTALIDTKGEVLLGISPVICLDYYGMIFSNCPICDTLYFFHFLSHDCRMMGNVKPAITFVLECRVLPNPRTEGISRSRVENMSSCMML